ncbi:MAG: hypothetical protein WCD21_40560 [Streptomyces sp.]
MEIVQLVVAWYSAEISKEWNAAVPDEVQLGYLKDAQRACIADLQALDDADSAKVASLKVSYAARYKELRAK